MEQEVKCNETPEISVIIPAYGHAATVSLAIQSALDQTGVSAEIIVVNDSSPDATRDSCKPFFTAGLIRYLEKPNGGPASARNLGLREARGKYIAFLDDDDLWPLDKLKWQRDYLVEKPNVVAVGGSATFFSDAAPDGNPAEELAPIESFSFEDVFRGNPFVSPGQLLIRRKAIDEIGGFREDIWGADDFELLFRLTLVGSVHKVSRTALYYRFHPNNASNNFIRMFKQTENVYKIHLPTASARGTSTLVKRSAALFLYLYGFHREINLVVDSRNSRQKRFHQLVSCLWRGGYLVARYPRVLVRLYISDLFRGLTSLFLSNSKVTWTEKGLHNG